MNIILYRLEIDVMPSKRGSETAISKALNRKAAAENEIGGSDEFTQASRDTCFPNLLDSPV